MSRVKLTGKIGSSGSPASKTKVIDVDWGWIGSGIFVNKLLKCLILDGKMGKMRFLECGDGKKTTILFEKFRTHKLQIEQQ